MTVLMGTGERTGKVVRVTRATWALRCVIKGRAARIGQISSKVPARRFAYFESTTFGGDAKSHLCRFVTFSDSLPEKAAINSTSCLVLHKAQSVGRIKRKNISVGKSADLFNSVDRATESATAVNMISNIHYQIVTV